MCETLWKLHVKSNKQGIFGPKLEDKMWRDSPHVQGAGRSLAAATWRHQPQLPTKTKGVRTVDCEGGQEEAPRIGRQTTGWRYMYVQYYGLNTVTHLQTHYIPYHLYLIIHTHDQTTSRIIIYHLKTLRIFAHASPKMISKPNTVSDTNLVTTNSTFLSHHIQPYTT